MITLILSLLSIGVGAYAAPVGNLGDPFTLHQGVFGDFGIFIMGGLETRERSFYSQETQTIRVLKNNFRTITLTRQKEDGALSAEAIIREGDQVKIPLQHDANGLFTLTLKGGDINLMKFQLGDKGPLVRKKVHFSQEEITFGVTYKNRLYLQGLIGSGSLSSRANVTWRVIENHGVTVIPDEGAESDETTKTVVDKITYEWDNESNTYSVDTRYETETDIIWGVGASMVMLEKPLSTGDTLRTGINVNYRKIDLSTQKNVSPLSDSEIEDKNNHFLSAYAWEVDEYQMAVSISYDMFDAIPMATRVSPYAGALFSYMKGTETYTLSNPVTTDEENRFIPLLIVSSDIEMVESVGFFVGMSLDFFDIVTLCVEQRMQDESSSHISFLMKF